MRVPLTPMQLDKPDSRSPASLWTMLRIARRNPTSPRWGEVNIWARDCTASRQSPDMA
jgi:hypothetical protein